MIRNSVVAGATAVVVAFAIWFQASATESHEVKGGERFAAETSQVESGTEADDDAGETKDESPSQDHSGKPGEVKP